MKLTPWRIQFLFLSMFFILQACNDNKENSDETGKAGTLKDSSQSSDNSLLPTDSAKLQEEENRIVDTIFKLPEVQEMQKSIDKQTAGKRSLKIFITDTPTTANNYHWVKVAEDNGSNLVTHFNFFVYPNIERIMYFDVVADKEMTLEEWRKTIR